MSEPDGPEANEISKVYDIVVDPYDPFDKPVGVSLAVGMNRFMRHLKSAPVDTLTGLGNQWEEIVGPRLSGVTRPVSLLDGVLLISCDDAPWASQLRWMEQSICTSVRNCFPDVEIRGIRVRQRHQ